MFKYLGNILDAVMIESSGATGTVEKYYPPLQLDHEHNQASAVCQKSNQEGLQLAVSAVNCKVDSEVLCPVMLLFEAISRPARTLPASSQMERA